MKFFRQFFVLCCAIFVSRASAAEIPIQHEIYIWQRNWSQPVLSSIRENGPKFSRLVSLKTEVAWKNGRMQVVDVPVDFSALRATKTEIGLALRIGAFSGPFEENDETILNLSRLAEGMLREAKTKGVNVCELQVDFDCAESKLSGYRVLVEVLRKKIAPMPLVITALPAWLENSDFLPLAKASDGFILQVHSFERPKNSKSPFSLCDPVKARQAVAKASALGVPFRVALPTYGYVVAFDSAGNYIGISAEGPSPQWPAGTELREVRSNPKEIAALISDWSKARPKNLKGVIWYRLPTNADALNWSWPTLSAVMTGEIPREKIEVFAKTNDKKLYDIFVKNSGASDFSLDKTVFVRWKNSTLAASDAVNGFELDSGVGAIHFRPRRVPPLNLKPNESRAIGWLRFSQETEVQFEIE